MAIYHFHGQVISKLTKDGKPKSPLAVAAYRSGEKLTDEQTDQTFFYKREVEPDTFILTPEHAPEWTKDRQTLWNEVSKIEKNYNAQFSREFNIALPVELSEEEQNKLAKDYCQEAFVDNGMVADIAIHRDDKNNPHFHVMLTVRPFKDNGEWGMKSKREYLFDDNGNHILDKNGKKKFRKVNTTNWNDKETFNHWRKLWADKTNKYLAKNDIADRITHLSNKDLGVERLPTIHEGYVARKMQKSGLESERVIHNENVRSYNKRVESINEYKEMKRNIKLENKFVRKFSPQEKKALSTIAKELRFFVNSETLSDRKSQLERWKKSVTFKADSEDKFNTLSRINKEEQAIKQAESILESESNRFIKSYYPTYDLDSLNYQEKIIIVDETLRQNNVLTDDQIDRLHMGIDADNLRKELSSILKNRWVFVDNVEGHLNLAKQNLHEVKNELGLPDKVNQEMIKLVIKEQPDKAEPFKDAAEKVIKLTEIKQLMDEFYNAEFKLIYPDKNLENLTLNEKELLLATHEYFGEETAKQNVFVSKYTTDDQLKIIDAMGMKYADKKAILDNQFPDLQWNNPIHIMLFKEECINNENLPVEYLNKIAKIDPERMGQYNINQVVPLENINEQMNQQALEKTGDGTIASGIAYSLRSMSNSLLNERTNDRLSKQQFEDDLKKKKKRKNQQNRGHTL